LNALRRIVALPFVIVAGASCGLLLDLHSPDARELPPLDDAATRDPCVHAAPPPLPDTEDEGEDVPPFWLALRSFDLASANGGLPGFDLDGVCTCDGLPNTAFDASPSCVPRSSARTHCDLEGGVDNAFGEAFAPYAAIFDSQRAGQLIADGRATVLIYIAGYNGKANDRSVKVGFARTDGIYTDQCDPNLVVDDAGPGLGASSKYAGIYTPSWRGCDPWHGEPSQLSNEGIPKSMGSGYVNDYRLVVRSLDDIPFFMGNVEATVHEPIVDAKLEKTSSPQRFRIRNGTIAGRVMLGDIGRIVFVGQVGGGALCEQPAAFRSIMDTLCPNIDSAESASLDHQGRPCTSMSFAFRFDADVVAIDRTNRVPPVDPTEDPCKGQSVPPDDVLCP
jgi:hypothetical protein